MNNGMTSDEVNAIQDAIEKMELLNMGVLSIKLGWQHRLDTFDTYFTKIGNYEIVVSKHNSETKWSCVLIQDDNEIKLSENTTVTDVLKIHNLLSYINQRKEGTE